MVYFSQRQGYNEPREIEFRDSLPTRLRVPILEILKDHLNARFLMERITAILDPYGITPLPRYKEPFTVPVEGDIQGRVTVEESSPDQVALRRVLLGCEWFQVYDILEDIFGQLRFYEEEVDGPGEDTRSYPLQKKINEYFEYAGIGWKMVNGQMIARQDEADETAIQEAISELEQGGRPTAAQRLHSAVRAISERPKPDTAGAVSHATGAVECVLGDILGNPSLALGKQLDTKQLIKYPFPIHPALVKALEGVYGFASDAGARHGKEGMEPDVEEARFVLTSCAAACSLLNARSPKVK